MLSHVVETALIAREQFEAEKQTDQICTVGSDSCCNIKRDEREAGQEEE